MDMKIGFSKENITPPVGTELGGYAGYRPCTGVHDELYCRAVVLEQEGVRYALAALDLMCVDEGLYQHVAEAVAPLGIGRERLIVSAIHSHAAPTGMVPGAGPLAKVNGPEEPKDPAFRAYILGVVEKTARAIEDAARTAEPFRIRWARGQTPAIGSERHTGERANGTLTVLEARTQGGKSLVVYNFPCHPTVLSAANTLVSRDFLGEMEQLLGADMAVFLNGAAGDISTRFTRRESSFAECARMAGIGAEQIRNLIEGRSFEEPEPLKGLHRTVTLKARELETEEQALAQLKETTARWKAAEKAGADPGTVRILKSYAEGAGVNLQFARTMAGIRELKLPVTVFRLGDLAFTTIPGELFSTLAPEGVGVIAYANGYYRYIADVGAYDAGYYEAMAAIARRGEGEKLREAIVAMMEEIQ